MEHPREAVVCTRVSAMVSVSFSLRSPIFSGSTAPGRGGYGGNTWRSLVFAAGDVAGNSPRGRCSPGCRTQSRGSPAEHFRKSKFHSKTGRTKEQGPALPSTGHGTLPPPPPPTLLIKKGSFSSFMSKEKKENEIVFFRVGFRPNPNASAF